MQQWMLINLNRISTSCSCCQHILCTSCTEGQTRFLQEVHAGYTQVRIISPEATLGEVLVLER